MNEQVKKDSEKLVEFWNRAFAMTEEEKKQTKEETDKEKDWLEIAPSKKLFDAAAALKDKKNVLDYGCGHGWAALIAAKSGCQKVTAVEVSEGPVEMARCIMEAFDVENQVNCMQVSTDWIQNAETESYDGIICSNVLDVIPEEISEDIIANFARIATKDATVVVGMNYYSEETSNKEKGVEVKNGNHIYVNGVLRMVSRTDEEWTESFAPYFEVEKLDHFAWPGEEVERRRLFILKKK